MSAMNIQNIFAERLVDLMQEQQLNISTLAEKTGIPRTSINNWLNQARSPKVEYIQKLAIFFGVSADYLLGLEDINGKKLY